MSEVAAGQRSLRDHLNKAKRLWFSLYDRILFERNQVIEQKAPEVELWPTFDAPPDASLEYDPIDAQDAFGELRKGLGSKTVRGAPEFLVSGRVYHPRHPRFHRLASDMELPDGRLLSPGTYVPCDESLRRCWREKCKFLSGLADKEPSWWYAEFIEPAKAWHAFIDGCFESLKTSLTGEDSIMLKRFRFEQQWKREHPEYNHQRDAKEMREAYIRANPDDAEVKTRGFSNARQWVRRKGLAE